MHFKTSMMQLENPYLSNFLLIVFIIFIACTIKQLLFYWGIFSRLAFFREKKKIIKKQPVSVVLCAKNEYYNLKKNLQVILEQDYFDFEVVVVNDSSNDESIDLLNELSTKYQNLKIVDIKQNLNFFSGKKFPLSLGIKSAKNELILLTDADCKPSSKNWISKMVSNFGNKTEIVLGYGPYYKRKDFLNKLIRFDTLHIAIQYLSFSMCGLTYMGVGRNLAYRKSLFYKSKGFISHYKIKSGDDDLFINRVANKNNTQIEIDPETFTFSEAEKTFSGWIKQKKRHLSTGKYYKKKFLFFLENFSLSQSLFYPTFIILLCFNYNIYFILSLFIIRLLSQLFILKKCMNKLNEKKLLVLSPFLELILIILNPFLLLSNLFVKQNKWK